VSHPRQTRRSREKEKAMWLKFTRLSDGAPDCPVSQRRQRQQSSARSVRDTWLAPKAYRVFNKSSGLVEVSSDVVFDKTNGSPREQVDLDDIDEEEVSTAAMRTMAIGEVRPQEQQEQDQPSSSTMVHHPTQDSEQVPQEEGQDQGGAQEEQVMGEEAPWVPPTQVRVTIQKHHPIDQILGDISKGVTTRSRLANFCEHYSFVSSIEPFRVEEALQDPNWVLAMQEELNNFKRNEV
jgi:hypothetical protein